MTTDVEIVSGIILAILLLTSLASYNALMQLRQDVRAAWAKMDDQLKNRYQLIPIFLTVVQNAGGAAAEKLAAVITAKNQAAVAFSPVQLAGAEAALTTGIQQLIAIADQQEGLKTDSRYLEIRRQLLNAEKLITQSSSRYNDQVDLLNASMSSFPYVWTAKMIGLRLQPLFGIASAPAVMA